MAKKKYTLEETWKYCLQMWKWIAKEKRAGSRRGVECLKSAWVLAHGLEKGELDNNCFFCEYALNKWQRCSSFDCICDCCPLAEENISCFDGSINYESRPIAFYNKLVSLNKKRKKKRSLKI